MLEVVECLPHVDYLLEKILGNGTGREAFEAVIDVREFGVDGFERFLLTSIGRIIRVWCGFTPEMSAEEKQEQRTIRCLMAKVGLDGHDRGAHVITRAFRDAGFEVIYSGLHKSPDEIVQAAVQEDVDVLGISILSGAHDTLVPKVMEGLEEYNALEDTLVLVGGIVPEEDRSELYGLGVAEIFGPGVSMKETIQFVRENVPER